MLSNRVIDAYFICQALGWEWNFQNMVLISVAPLLIFGLIILIIFVIIPFISSLFE